MQKKDNNAAKPRAQASRRQIRNRVHAPRLRPFKIADGTGLQAVLGATRHYGDNPRGCLLEVESAFRCLSCGELIAWVQIGKANPERFDAELQTLRPRAYIGLQTQPIRYFARLLCPHDCRELIQ
jgi:hypothetical protein